MDYFILSVVIDAAQFWKKNLIPKLFWGIALLNRFQSSDIDSISYFDRYLRKSTQPLFELNDVTYYIHNLPIESVVINDLTYS